MNPNSFTNLHISINGVGSFSQHPIRSAAPIGSAAGLVRVPSQHIFLALVALKSGFSMASFPLTFIKFKTLLWPTYITSYMFTHKKSSGRWGWKLFPIFCVFQFKVKKWLVSNIPPLFRNYHLPSTNVSLKVLDVATSIWFHKCPITNNILNIMCYNFLNICIKNTGSKQDDKCHWK